MAALLWSGVGAAIPTAQMPPVSRETLQADEAELWYAMDRAELELRQSPLLVKDPALNAYARKVLCKVTQGQCAQLRLYIVDLPWFNAAMAPNGAMIVWTGSLLRIRNEAQLGLVLGHEFGHYRERHTLQQWRRLKKSSAFLGTLGVLTSGAGMGVAGMAANLAGMASMMKFSRDKEREADRVGFGQLAQAGYDARAAVELWDAMLHEEDARDYGKPLPVFSTHPRTRERRDDLRAAAETMAGSGRDRGESAHAIATRPFLKHWLENELSRRMYASSIAVIEDVRKSVDSNDAGLVTFFLGEAYRRRGGAEDRLHAAKLYRQSLAEPGSPPEAWREHGLVLKAAGDYPGATAALRRYLEVAPMAQDREFVVGYLSDMEHAQ